MAAVRHRQLEAGPVDASAPAVLFVHDFPELWYSWHHQMGYLAVRGYRCVAPDLRGYGGTTAPPEPSSYTVFHIVGDLVALVDTLHLPQEWRYEQGRRNGQVYHELMQGGQI